MSNAAQFSPNTTHLLTATVPEPRITGEVSSATRQVIALEQQGHGHTADIDRPFSALQWALDTSAALQHLQIEQADFLGYSSGGAVALEIALHSPATVRKLVWAGGTSYQRDGLYRSPKLTQGWTRQA